MFVTISLFCENILTVTSLFTMPRKKARAALLKLIVLDRTLDRVQEICEFQTPSYTQRRRNKRLQQTVEPAPASYSESCPSPSDDGIDYLECGLDTPDCFCEWCDDVPFFAFE